MSAKSKPTGRSWFLRHKILTAIAALFIVGVVGSAFDGGDSGGGTPAGLTGPVASSTTTAAVVTPLAAPSTVTVTEVVTVTAAPTKTKAPVKAAKKPTPKPSATKKKAAVRKTSAPSIRSGVHPGSFCSPAGALGRTSAGTLMRCKTKPGDSRNRWRAA